MTVILLDYEGFKNYDKDNGPWKSLQWLEAFMFVCLKKHVYFSGHESCS